MSFFEVLFMTSGVFVFIVVYYNVKSRISVQKTGELKLKNYIAIAGWGCLLISGLALYDLINDRCDDVKQLYSAVAVFSLFAFSSVYAFVEYFYIKGVFNEKYIDFYSPWTGRKVELWDDLETIENCSFRSWSTLVFKSGNKIRLSDHLTGLEDIQKILDLKEESDDEVR